MKKYLELVQGQFTAEHAEKAMQTEYPYVAYSVENDEVLFGFEPMVTRMVLTEDSGGQVQLSANGLVIIEYMQDGEKVRNTYSALSGTYVPIPVGVEATIYGAVTDINSDKNAIVFASIDVSNNTALISLSCNESNYLTSLDVSKNTALTSLNCSATGLTSLDVSKNTALTSLNCRNCTSLMLLDIQNTSSLTAGKFLDQSMANLTTLQVAGTSAWAYEKVESWLSDFAPNDGTILVDENTPQEVITAATAKNWTVEYVDA